MLKQAAEKERKEREKEKEEKQEEKKKEDEQKERDKNNNEDEERATTTATTATSSGIGSSTSTATTTSTTSPALPNTGTGEDDNGSTTTPITPDPATSSPATTTPVNNDDDNNEDDMDSATSTPVGVIIGQIKDKLTPPFLKTEKKPEKPAVAVPVTESENTLVASTDSAVNPLKQVWSSFIYQNVYELDSFSPATTRALNSTALTLAILGFLLLSGIPQYTYERMSMYRGVGRGKTVVRTRG